MNEEELLKIIQDRIINIGQPISNMIERINESIEVLRGISNIPQYYCGIYERVNSQLLKYTSSVSDIRSQIGQLNKEYEDGIKDGAVNTAGKIVGGIGAAGGLATALAGPTIAMSVATTFGVASTGTAISALAGAPAINAALAWLGGGAVAAGGGGMAGGLALLGVTIPVVGWAIAGVGLVVGGLTIGLSKKSRKENERIIGRISDSQCAHLLDINTELEERKNGLNNNYEQIGRSLDMIRNYGNDYNNLQSFEQYELINFINLLQDSINLCDRPINSMRPILTNDDYDNFYRYNNSDFTVSNEIPLDVRRNIIMLLVNRMYYVQLTDIEYHRWFKILRNSRNFLKETHIEKQQFTYNFIETANNIIARLRERNIQQ